MNELRLEGNDGGGVSWSLPEHGGMMDQEEGTGKWGRRGWHRGRSYVPFIKPTKNGHKIAKKKKSNLLGKKYRPLINQLIYPPRTK